MLVKKLLTFSLLPLFFISASYADFFDGEREFNDLKAKVQGNFSDLDKDFSKYGNYNKERSESHYSYEERTKSSSSSARINTDSVLENVGEYVTGLVLLNMFDQNLDDKINKRVEAETRRQLEEQYKNNEIYNNVKVANEEKNQSFDNIFESDDHIFTDDSSIFN